MDFFTISIFGLMGLLALTLIFAVVVLIARSAGAFVKICMRSDESSSRYAARTTSGTYCVILVFFIYQVYTAIFPSTSFYLDEFQSVTARRAPAEAKVIARDATYPDFHGDYCSFSRIAFNESSYHGLLNELKKDERFSEDGDGEISRGGLGASNLTPLRAINSFSRSDVRSDQYYRISFLENLKEIEVEICVT